MATIRNIDQLIVRFLGGECTPQEEAFLLRWQAESEANRKFFILMRDVWMASSARVENDPALVATEFARFKARTAAEATPKAEATSPTPPAAPRKRLRYAPYAAAAVFILGILFFWSLWLDPKPQRAVAEAVPAQADSVAWVAFETKPGSIASITLPDGTRVKLNSQSVLRYPTDFDRRERNVELSGEAFFEVAPGSEHQFVVNARALKVTAHGTSFNVSAYPDDRLVTTTLETGKVTIDGISVKGLPFHIPMTPKQTVMILADDEESPSEHFSMKEREALDRMEENQVRIVRFTEVRTEIYTSWKDERWIVEHETLGSLTDKLRRRYNVNINFQDTRAAKYNFTGIFENETIDEIMAILRHTVPIRYRMEKGNIEISTDISRQPAFFR